MKILDPHLKDGVHEWRDGKRFVKEGVKLYLEGTDTLAGRYVLCRPVYAVLTTGQALSLWTLASATFRVSRVVLWARRSNAPRSTLLGASALRTGKAHFGPVLMRTS